MKYSKCQECKRCCNNFTSKDFIIQLTDKERLSLKKDEIRIKPGENCPYLKNGCTIEKPFICRHFPFFIKDNQIFIDKNCPIKELRKLDLGKKQLIEEFKALNLEEQNRINQQY